MIGILISVMPQWVKLILNGEKTIEVRKRFPLNYRGWVYIYCTKELPLYIRRDMSKEAELYGIDMTKKCYIATVGKAKHNSNYPYDLSGKVVARFYCDNVEGLFTDEDSFSYYTDTIQEDYKVSKLACLDDVDIDNYLNGDRGYAIHISQLEIFDKPKELSEFCKVGYLEEETKLEKEFKYMKIAGVVPSKDYVDFCYRTIGERFRLTKAPQSWCYVVVEL